MAHACNLMCMLSTSRLHPKIQAVEGAGGTHVAGHTLLHLDLGCDLSHFSGHEGEPCGTAPPATQPTTGPRGCCQTYFATADEHFCKVGLQSVLCKVLAGHYVWLMCCSVSWQSTSAPQKG